MVAVAVSLALKSRPAKGFKGQLPILKRWNVAGDTGIWRELGLAEQCILRGDFDHYRLG